MLMALTLMSLAFAVEPPWRRIETLHFLVEYTKPDAGIARTLADRVDGVAAEVATETGWEPDKKVRVILSPDTARFRQAIPGYPPAPYWAQGLAYPREYAIVLKSPRIVPGMNLLSVFIHEYTHILLGTRYHSGRIPVWLNEGLAMHLAGEWSWSRNAHMMHAVLGNRLIPLRELERGFPSDKERARIAYAQSYYVIVFLRTEYGTEALRDFLKYYVRGFTFEESLYRATGMRYDELEREWMSFIRFRFSWFPLLTSAGTLWFVMVVLFLVAYVRHKRRTLRKLEAWKQEETENAPPDDPVLGPTERDLP